MNITEKEEAINELEKELKALKEEHSFFNNLMNTFTKFIDEDEK